MRFTEGLWSDRRGMKIHRAHSVWRYEIKDSAVSVMVPCTEIRTLKNTIHGPNLHFTFSSPRTDMISVKVDHFTGGVEKTPDFQLNCEQPRVVIEENDTHITMTSGKTQVVMTKSGIFAYSFYYDGKLLTGGGNRGISYATDVDYEAEVACDYDGREAPAHYMKETYIREVLDLGVGESIYGLGERFGAFVKNGQTVDIWNRDGGSASDMGYKNIPFYLSSKSYGVFVNTPDRVEFEVGSVNVRYVEFSVEGEGVEYIVIGGAQPKEVLSKYTALTGRAALPPAWSFGLWLSSSWMPDSDEKITLELIDGMKERGIPLSVFHFDARWMDDYQCCDFVWSDRFGDVKSLLKQIHDRGVKVCVWINPYVSQSSHLFQVGKEKGYFIKRTDGSVYQADHWMHGIAIVDFTNPAATAWYMACLEELVDTGVDTIKTDFGERIPVKGVVYHDGSDPRKMHNYYPYLYNQAVFGMLEKKLGKGQACVFSRSATPGTQKFPVNWGGDNDSSYVSMAESLRGGLSFCQSGYGYWAHDISGFENTATPDLYKRWSAFGMLSTHSRLHGMVSYRVPWMFDDEAGEVLAHFTRLKCALMPYLFAGAVHNHTTGEPLMRAMVLEFPEDLNCRTLDRQYMLGDSLLVAPVFQEDGEADFYLPDGQWTDYQEGGVLEGGKWHRRKYDYFHMPLLARANSIIPRGHVDSRPEYDYAKDVVYQIFSLEDGKEAAFTICDMQGKETATAKASRSGKEIRFSVSGGSWSLQLAGIQEIAGVRGGAQKQDSRGLIITPESGVSELLIQLNP